MKYLPLIWAGLWRKRTRTTLTLLSIVVAFVLIGVLAGVNAAFAHALAAARLDRLFVTSQIPLPIAYADQIARVPGVTMVVPRTGVFGYYQNPKQRQGAIAVTEQFFALKPELRITREHLQALRQTRTGAVAAQVLANKYGWKIGDKVPIYAVNASQANGSPIWTFTIVGMVEDTDFPQNQWFIGNYDYIDQGRASGKGTSDGFMVRIQDPARATQIARQIDDVFANSAAPTSTFSERDGAESNLQSLGDSKFLTTAIVGAVLFMLLFVTGNTMMQSVRERIPEFAMIKTLGFSDRAVLSFIIAESVLLCAFAALIGVLLSKILISLAQGQDYSFFLFQTSWTATARAVGLALAIAVASAALPAWRVQRLSIVDALAGR